MRRWLVRQLMPAKQLELLTFDATAAASHRAAPYAPLLASALSPAAWFMLCNNAMGHEMQYVTWNVGRTAILFRFKRANTRVYYKDHAELFLCCIYRGYSRWEDICRPTWCGAACFFFFLHTYVYLWSTPIIVHIRTSMSNHYVQAEAAQQSEFLLSFPICIFHSGTRALVGVGCWRPMQCTAVEAEYTGYSYGKVRCMYEYFGKVAGSRGWLCSRTRWPPTPSLCAVVVAVLVKKTSVIANWFLRPDATSRPCIGTLMRSF